MKIFPHILARLRRTIWASTPQTVEAVRDLIAAAMEGRLDTDLDPASAIVPRSAQAAAMFGEQAAEGGEVQPYAIQGTTAIVPVFGVIGKHLSQMEIFCGGLDVDALCSAVGAASFDDSVDQIVLWINSPGGTVTGVPEAADYIRRVSSDTPLYAYTDGQMCSAAYWLASGCEQIFAAPSADVGSVGVYLSWINQEQALENAGLKLELIKAGDFKAMGHPLKSLTEAEAAKLQEEVDQIWAQFKAAATSRRAIDESAMQGHTVKFSEQLTTGLVDAQYNRLGDLLADLEAAR